MHQNWIRLLLKLRFIKLKHQLMVQLKNQPVHNHPKRDAVLTESPEKKRQRNIKRAVAQSHLQNRLILNQGRLFILLTVMILRITCPYQTVITECEKL